MTATAMAPSDESNLKILLVEDNADALVLVKGMLSSIGYQQVVTAQDGRQALEVIETLDDDGMFDVILCDWNMPHVSGLEVLKQVRTFAPDVPFMMVTGETDGGATREARDSGATTCLTKPFSQDALSRKMSVVERLLAGRAGR